MGSGCSAHQQRTPLSPAMSSHDAQDRTDALITVSQPHNVHSSGAAEDAARRMPEPVSIKGSQHLSRQQNDSLSLPPAGASQHSDLCRLVSPREQTSLAVHPTLSSIAVSATSEVHSEGFASIPLCDKPMENVSKLPDVYQLDGDAK